PAYIGPVSSVAVASVGGQPALIYNPDYLGSLYRKTNNRWSVIAILAHALGHIEGPNAGRTGGEAGTLLSELQADHFAGRSLRRLGASLDDALAAVRAGSGSDNANQAIRPSREKRVQEIKDGYTKSDRLGSPPSDDPKTNRPTEPTRQPTIQVPC